MYADQPFQERTGKTVLPNDQKPETISRFYHYEQVDVDPWSVNLPFDELEDVLTYLASEESALLETQTRQLNKSLF